jgi:predicted RNase H-like HicB family nuclease
VSSKRSERGQAVQSRIFAVVFKEDPKDHVIVAAAPSFPGVVVQGETQEEAEKRIAEAIAFAIENKQKRGVEPPAGNEVVQEVPVEANYR